MIQSQVHRIHTYSSTNKQDISLPHYSLFHQFNQSQNKLYNSSSSHQSHQVLSQVGQSKKLSNKQENILENSQKSCYSENGYCGSCVYWESWAYQCEKKILLIEKKLIDRQKVLQQKMKFLQNQLKNNDIILKRKQQQFQEQRINHKQAIKTSFQRVKELELLLTELIPDWRQRFLIHDQMNKETQYKKNINNVIKNGLKINKNMREDYQKFQKQKNYNLNSLISQTSQFFQSSQNETNRKMEPEFKYFNFKRNKNNQDFEKPVEGYNDLDSIQRNQLIQKKPGNFQKKQVEHHTKEIGFPCSGTSLADPLCSRNTLKTIKLHNNKVNVEKSIFNQTTTECSFVNESKKGKNSHQNSNYNGNYNGNLKQKNDELTTLISHQGNENYKNGNPQIYYTQNFYDPKNNIRSQNNHEISQELKRLKFENQNLKSYNRVLLQKLSNSRPKKY